MAVLDWIGKRAVVNHHREVPTRLLHCNSELSFGDPEAGNLLVEGDNLEALKSLLPYYAGKVKCIYIDPPYNTGNEGWIYNDNVNSPEILAWLGKVTGKEAEDFTRHDKWLCMMYPRLRILREFLSDDGLVFVSIDDVEFARLRLLLDEIFGQSGFVSAFVWKSRKFLDSRSLTNVSNDHEYIMCYRMSEDARLRGLERDEAKFSNPDGDDRGSWMSRSILGLANSKQRPNLHYSIADPNTGFTFAPPLDTGWRYGRERMDALIADGRIIFPKDQNGRPREKKFKDDLLQQFMSIPSIIDDVHTADGSDEIRAIFGYQAFDFPKPVELIKRLIEQVVDGPTLILDSFAGSGTTAQAVLTLKAAGADCRFIVVEMLPEVAREVTAERIKRVITGYQRVSAKGVSENVKGLGGGFRYCTLGRPLFDEWGGVSEGVTYSDLAAFVFFSDTGSPIPVKATGETTLLGSYQGRAVHLQFAAGSLGVPNEGAGNVLTLDALEGLAPNDGPRVVYAEGCTVPAERLAAAGVVFKQVPYQLQAT
jgi:site-specific DNA-methyltransferase (adenine-specific)/adenine-specific DNA-methyltransferase